MTVQTVGLETVPTAGTDNVVSLPENKRDKASDQKILECLSSKQLSSQVIHYHYNHTTYTFRIVNNPESKTLTNGNRGSFEFPNAVFVKGVFPTELKSHLDSLFIAKTGKGIRHLSSGTLNGVQAFDFSANLQPVPEHPKDAVTDEKIKSLFATTSFTQETVPYLFAGKTYHIFVLNNPDKLPLWSSQLKDAPRIKFILSSREGVPNQLIRHLIKLVPAYDEKGNDFVIDFGQNLNPFQAKTNYSLLSPVEIAPEGKPELLDDQLKQCFRTKEKVNKVFFYTMNNTLYKVRIIHNPEKEPLKARKSYMNSGPLTFTWPHPYGAMFNPVAPQSLIDHISKVAKETLPPASKLVINNGEKGKAKSETGPFVYTSNETVFELFENPITVPTGQASPNSSESGRAPTTPKG